MFCVNNVTRERGGGGRLRKDKGERRRNERVIAKGKKGGGRERKLDAVKCRKGHSEAMRLQPDASPAALIDPSSLSFSKVQFNSSSFIDTTLTVRSRVMLQNTLIQLN